MNKHLAVLAKIKSHWHRERLEESTLRAWAKQLQGYVVEDVAHGIEELARHSDFPSLAQVRAAAERAAKRRWEQSAVKALPSGRPVERGAEYLRKRKVANRIVFVMAALGKPAPDEMWHAYMGGRLEDAQADLDMVVSNYIKQKGRRPSFGPLEAVEQAAGGKA